MRKHNDHSRNDRRKSVAHRKTKPAKASLAGLVIVYFWAGLVFPCMTQNPVVASTKEWKRYDLSTGSFSVLLPGKPVEIHLASDPTMVVPVENYTYSLVTEQGIFITTRALIGGAAERWSASAASAYFDGFWDSFAAGLDKQMETSKLPYRTKLLDRHKATLSGYDGQEMVFTVGALQGRVLITRIGRHSFLAAALRPETSPAADVERFFSSFTINPSWLSEHKPAE